MKSMNCAIANPKNPNKKVYLSFHSLSFTANIISKTGLMIYVIYIEYVYCKL